MAANAYLEHLALARAGGRTKVTAINWGIWTGVGMAAEAMEARVGRAGTPPEPVSRPMIDAKAFDGEGRRVFTASWAARERWWLNEHRTAAGDALLPGTGFLELIAEALANRANNCLSRSTISPSWHPCARRMTPPSPCGLRWIARPPAMGVVVESALGGGFVTHAEAQVSLLPLPVPPQLDIAATAARLPAPEKGALVRRKRRIWPSGRVACLGRAQPCRRRAGTADLARPGR